MYVPSFKYLAILSYFEIIFGDFSVISCMLELSFLLKNFSTISSIDP